MKVMGLLQSISPSGKVLFFVDALTRNIIATPWTDLDTDHTDWKVKINCNTKHWSIFYPHLRELQTKHVLPLLNNVAKIKHKNYTSVTSRKCFSYNTVYSILSLWLLSFESKGFWTCRSVAISSGTSTSYRHFTHR